MGNLHRGPRPHANHLPPLAFPRRPMAVGVTDAEIVEIVMIAAAAVLSDIIADALKIEVDPMVLQMLGRG